MFTALVTYLSWGCEPVRWEDVDQDTWKGLIADGWTGRPHDDMAALYPQTADASERDCLKSLHRPRNESFETQLKKLAYTRLKSGLGLVTRLPTASVINIAQKLG